MSSTRKPGASRAARSGNGALLYVVYPTLRPYPAAALLFWTADDAWASSFVEIFAATNPRLANYLRIEERELEAGGLN